MEQQLTPELLIYLKSEGYTMLVGEGQADWDEYVYTPVKWDVEAFLNDTMKYSFDDHSIYIIDEMLKLEFDRYYMHRVIL
jgi:hypothetical protein